MAKENNQAKEKILKKEERYNKETKEAIEEAKDIIKNPNKYKSFNSVEELMEDLNQ